MDTHQMFTVDLNVRFRDMDANRHVNNAVFFTYFEEGRRAFFQKHFERVFVFPFILAHAACDYKKPISLNDDIQLAMWVGDIGNKRFDFIYRIIGRQDTTLVYALGKSTQVSFDYQKQKSIVIPKHVAELLVPYQDISLQKERSTIIKV